VSLDITQRVARLRSELELIEVAIRALERFAKGLENQEYTATPRKRNRSKPKTLGKIPIPRADEVSSKIVSGDLMQSDEAGGETIRSLSQ
jgi:hypothetical protein